MAFTINQVKARVSFRRHLCSEDVRSACLWLCGLCAE